MNNEHNKINTCKSNGWRLPHVFLRRVIARLLEDVDKKLEEGKNNVPAGIRLVLTGTENIGTLEIDEPGPDNPDQRSFIVHVVREGTDRAYTHYLKDGTIDELKEYLLSF